MKDHRFIVVEGINGAGKTTLCRALAERLPAAMFHYTPEFRRLRRDLGLDERVAPLTRWLVYLAASLHLSDLVKEALGTQDVVSDRYVASIASMLVVEGALTRAALEAASAPFEPSYAIPSCTLLLAVDPKCAAERIRRRASEEPGFTEQRVVASADYAARWQDELRRDLDRRGGFVEIETTGLDADEVAAEALELLARM